MEVTDAQVHIWRAPTRDRPWPEEGYAFAHGTGDFTAEMLLRQMDEVGVGRAVLVPPSFEGDYNDAVIDATRRYPDRFAAMGRIQLDAPSSPRRLRTWRDTPGMLGVRLTFWLERHLQQLRDGTADWLFAEADKQALPIMIYAPSAIPEISELAGKYPNAPIILDHLAIDLSLTGAAIDEPLERVLRLSELPNLAVKASGLPALVDEPYPFPSLGGRLKRVIDAYGRDRVFWGSDLTRLDCTYEEAVGHFTGLGFLTAEDLAVIMDRGVRNWLRWPLQSARTT